jgi:hypothetical protein
MYVECLASQGEKNIIKLDMRITNKILFSKWKIALLRNCKEMQFANCKTYKEITYSFRIEQAVTIKILSNMKNKNQFIICKKIANAIDIHCKAMESVLCIW